MNRRTFLRMMISSSVIISVPAIMPAALAGPGSEETLLFVSQTLTGRQGLDPAISQRLYLLLSRQTHDFDQQLTRLAERLRRHIHLSPEERLAQLSEEEVTTALSIITPWYLGYTGNPATTRATDDAQFVTFLSALMYEPTVSITPRPSYSQRGHDYWQAVPEGVTAPPMPENITAWGTDSPRAARVITEPQPEWLAMVEGRARTHADAVRLLSHAEDVNHDAV